MKKYQHVCLGGTFDRLHIGHKSLLDLAFKIGDKVSIGLARKVCSEDKLLTEIIKDYWTRKRELENYLKIKKFLRRASVYPLDDVYGTAVSDKTLEAIIVSKKTYPNALKINELRKQKKLPLMKIIVTPFVLGDDGKVITSGRIRAGEIDREGKSYELSVGTAHWAVRTREEKKLILPEYLRQELRKPIGQVIAGGEDELGQTAKKMLRLINRSKRTMVISVGDVITNSLLKIGFDPEIKIVDFRVRRKPIINPKSEILNSKQIQNSNVQNVIPAEAGIQKNYIDSRLHGNDNLFRASNSEFRILNKAGTISVEVMSAFKSALKNYLKTGNKQLIIIDGEEDLTVLPAILLAPLDSLVLYGQMGLGVVAVSVTEEKKKEVKEILRKFV